MCSVHIHIHIHTLIHVHHIRLKIRRQIHSEFDIFLPMHICRRCTKALTPEEAIAIKNDKNLTGHHVMAKSRQKDRIKDLPREKKCKGLPPAANVFSLIHRSSELILFYLHSGQA